MTGQPPQIVFDPSTRALSLSPRDPAFVQDPYRAYAFMHARARAFFWAELGIWCFAGHDAVGALLRDRRLGRERPGGYMAFPAGAGDRTHLADFDRAEASSLLEVEPPVHTRLRTLVNRAFVSRQVERLRPRIAALAHQLVDAIEAKGQADLIPDFATPIPIIIICEVLGVPVEDGARLLDWSHRMVKMYVPNRDRGVEDDANAAARAFSDFIREKIEHRRARPGDDLLSLLISAHATGGKLSEDELVSSAILLLNAGHEATVHQAGNAIRTILLQGVDPRRFFATPEATVATVEECLRFDAPLHLFTRYVYEDLDLPDGVGVAAGEKVGLLLGAANRDPAAFTAPESFDPARADQKNVSFGAGIHFCIGAPLARLELQVALKVLFDRLPGLRLNEQPVYRDSWHFHGLESLRVVM